jgi:hypothetical protein
MSKYLSENNLYEIVKISPYYQRSILLNADVDNSEAIAGYICHETARKLLINMTQQVAYGNQRAFTWTGPFGTGKSILALALTSALTGNETQRKEARALLEAKEIECFDSVFPCTSKGWLVLPIVGTHTSVTNVLAEELQKATGIKSDSPVQLLENLSELSNSQKFDGILVIVDEMGKFLQASETAGDDIYFFQELAELTSRAKGNLLLIGILHQAFKQYARTQKLTEKVQNDWAKVQGRFVDLPFVTSSDEVVGLISNAIDVSEPVTIDYQTSETVYDGLKKRRPAVSSDLAEKLHKCWPLHPVTTLLLGPVSKRQFGQNERSIFGFLGSLEPYGFQEFLKASEVSGASYYSPENYWDYLKANLEPVIINSLDSHRWSIATEALERVEAKGSPLHISLFKNIAIIDLFKNGSGLAADKVLLKTIYPEVTENQINEVLAELESWKVVIYRKFNEAWSIFEGSDFDIESAIKEALNQQVSLAPQSIEKVANFHPVIAKRHLHQSGALRWMGMSISDTEHLASHIENSEPNSGEFGQFILLIDAEEKQLAKIYKKAANTIKEKNATYALGAPEHNSKIMELIKELLALEVVASRRELEGDPIARKEVSIRIASTRNNLDRELAYATNKTKWVLSDKLGPSNSGNLSRLASDCADSLFCKAPKILSEMVNRDELSSNSVKARRDLLHNMLRNEQFESLNIKAFPAEKGLYLTCLYATGIHRKKENSDEWYISEPAAEQSLRPAWDAALELITNEDNTVSCKDIYKLWSLPPYGIKQGLMPILLWALILSSKDKLALYKEGYYIPEPNDVDIDISLQNIGKFEIKGVSLNQERMDLLEAISDVLQSYLGSREFNDPLKAARGLVRIVFTLPDWVKKTRDISHTTMRFRDCILRASDPHKVLFHDIQKVFDTQNIKEISLKIKDSLEELTQSHSKLVKNLTGLLFEQLNASTNDIDALKARAQVIKNTGQQFVNAFINHLVELDLSQKSIIDIYALLGEMSFEKWTDQDIRNARNKLVLVAKEFRELEIVAQVNKRTPSRQALAIVYGGAPGSDFVQEFDMFERDKQTHKQLSEQVMDSLNCLPEDEQLSVLARAIETLRNGKKEQAHG